MQSTTPILIPKKAQDGLTEYVKMAVTNQMQNWNIREIMRQVDLRYIRELDWTKENRRARAANNYGDADKFQNITVPIVMPQVEAAVTYQSSVFLTGHPIFGVVASGANMDAALQMETVIDDQATKGQWVREFQKAFRDGFKYNLFALEVTWGRRVTAAFETDINFSTREARPKEVVWEGNVIKRWDLYNSFWDKTVPPTELHSRGEYAGRTELYSRIGLKQFIAELPDKMVANIRDAFESGLGTVSTADQMMGYYVPELNPEALIDPQLIKYNTNWLAWAGIANGDPKINYKDMYLVTTMYARILPSDFGLKVPSANTPQVWKLIFVNYQVLIYAERQTNAHGNIPVLMGQPNEDGLDYQTKSLANNVAPMQDLTSALWNSVIAARRRAISDRTLYDPSRILAANINSDNPSAKIPVRPAAYGKPVSEAVYPFPFRDDQSAIIMQESQQVMRMADMISGLNPVRQGQFVKGNKTRREFDTVMANANGRDQVVSLLLEAQLFTPLKEMLKLNILQYQGGVSLYNRDKEVMVTIDPVALRKSVLEFKISDGLIPSEKIISGEAIGVAMQTMANVPQIGAEYNVGQIFSYFIKLQGGKIDEFKKPPEQVAYEQALAQWQAAMQGIAESLKGADQAMVQQIMKQMPPQPQPQQFGYNPQQMAVSAVQPPVQVATRVNNITNNITNNE